MYQYIEGNCALSVNDWIAAGHIGNSWVEFMATEIGGTDCYWDSVCNIRKYENA